MISSVTKPINLTKTYFLTRYISVLYLPGDKAKETFAVLYPYMNFSDVFQDPEKMRKNIQNRSLDYKFDDIEVKYKRFETLITEKKRLEFARTEIVDTLRSVSSKDKDNDAMNKIKEEGRNVREKLKTVKEKLYVIEDDFIKDFLRLPNKLHKNCPLKEHQVIYRKDLPDENVKKNPKMHLSRTDLIDFKDPTCYYLLNEAANFDLELTHTCTNYMSKKGYIQMKNPDFVRRILLEAADLENLNFFQEIEEEYDTNVLNINTLHLNGGGSFTSFLGFITKLSIFPSLLPLKLISSGRQYYFDENKLNDQGLFTAMQSNIVQVFTVTETDELADIEMDNILNLTVDIYKKLGIHFQIVYKEANQITSSESLKASIQMFSPYFNKYVEVGHVSNYSDYISRRLLFNIKDGKSYRFPKIVGGPIVNVSKVLACLIENNVKIECPNLKHKSENSIENFKNMFT